MIMMRFGASQRESGIVSSPCGPNSSGLAAVTRLCGRAHVGAALQGMERERLFA